MNRVYTKSLLQTLFNPNRVKQLTEIFTNMTHTKKNLPQKEKKTHKKTLHFNFLSR